jgi:hypothetical protein
MKEEVVSSLESIGRHNREKVADLVMQWKNLPREERPAFERHIKVLGDIAEWTNNAN